MILFCIDIQAFICYNTSRIFVETMWITLLNKLIPERIRAMTMRKTVAYLLASFLFFDLFSPQFSGALIGGSASLEKDVQDTVIAYDISQKPVEILTRQVIVTAYSSTPDQTDSTPFITAANTHVRDGIVAANFLPLHTKIKIPNLFGEKIFVVEDRMNRRYQNRVDIWFPTRAAALAFGMKKAEIIIIDGIGNIPDSSYGGLAMLTN